MPDSTQKEEEFTVIVELHVKGFGKAAHQRGMAESLLRDAQLKHGTNVKAFVVEEEGDGNGRVKRQVLRTDRNGASFDAGNVRTDPSE